MAEIVNNVQLHEDQQQQQLAPVSERRRTTSIMEAIRRQRRRRLENESHVSAPEVRGSLYVNPHLKGTVMLSWDEVQIFARFSSESSRPSSIASGGNMAARAATAAKLNGKRARDSRIGESLRIQAMIPKARWRNGPASAAQVASSARPLVADMDDLVI